jgi:malonyl-CoA O-methyltransferase
MALANTLRRLKRRVAKRRFELVGGSESDARFPAPFRALAWIRSHELTSGGVAVHSGSPDAYPEVTGYLVPTLLKYGERELAARLTRWLLCIQRADGSFTSPEGSPHIFDTAQVLRGLLAAGERVDGALDAARRAADFLCDQAIRDGEAGFGKRYQNDIPETVHLYALPPLIEAAERLNEPRYLRVGEDCADFYCAHPDALKLDHLTHFLAYELEALIDLGRAELATPILDELSALQAEDGSVRGRESADWVCSPGLAQLAICWYKVGQWEAADSALRWMESHQQSTGGFLGSYGAGADYFATSELSWSAKFYLDAHQLRVVSFFARHADIFPSDVSSEDGRARAIIDVVKPGDRVVEVGCGKGRFLKAVIAEIPTVDCTGIDICPELLSRVPTSIRTLNGSLEEIPCADDSCEVVYSIEAIEHSANPSAAIAEMIRVARPGGWIMVIDKQESQWGRMETPSWESWPETAALRELLSQGCDEVSAEPVGYDGLDSSDGLMVVWRGRKRSRLSGSDWHGVLLSGSHRNALVDRIRRNKVTEWGQEILLATRSDQKVLEIGSGTGEISLFLAQAGRRVTVIDYSAESLAFVRRCSADLGVEVETVLADATRALPIRDDEFDCTWSSGLLEHFEASERCEMLREWARVTRGVLIDLVPNGACVGYRAGKSEQEARGEWIYGLEMPLLTQRDDFEAAGLRVLSEYSVGAKHALNFLANDHPLRHALSDWMDEKSPEELRALGQGYLLVTIGQKNDSRT